MIGSPPEEVIIDGILFFATHRQPRPLDATAEVSATESNSDHLKTLHLRRTDRITGLFGWEAIRYQQYRLENERLIQITARMAQW